MAEVGVNKAVFDFFALVLGARDEFKGPIVLALYGNDVPCFEFDILNPFPW